jgi:hypothetical protein
MLPLVCNEVGSGVEAHYIFVLGICCHCMRESGLQLLLCVAASTLHVSGPSCRKG